MEAIDDIVGDIRAQNQGLPEDGYALSPLVSDLLRLADRIEAAHKREREATCKDSLQVGDMAAMREALEVMLEWYYELHDDVAAMDAAMEKARDALDKPPRNCDIMDWRTAWTKWRTELHTQKPVGYAEVVNGTEQFMDWYISEAKGETK